MYSEDKQWNGPGVLQLTNWEVEQLTDEVREGSTHPGWKYLQVYIVGYITKAT